MADISSPSPEVVAVRCHDVTLSLQGAQVADFDRLLIVGMAVRLALHLRGVPAVSYDLLRQIGLHLLHIPPTSLERVVKLLAEIDFLKVKSEGETISAIVPDVPYYEDLFVGIGMVATDRPLSEPEQLTIQILDRLSRSPAARQLFYNSGAEKRLVERMVIVGTEGGYISGRRARGRDMLLSPIYFPENGSAFTDLAAGAGSGPVARVISLLAKNQGWPLALLQKTGKIGDTPLSADDVAIISELAKEGFTPPPVIKTAHAGTNHFIFGPRPGLGNVLPTQRHIYEAAMALVAAVRQGQLLPRQYKIKWPESLLQSLKDSKWLRANTEALAQYKQLVVLRLGRLVPAGGDWHRFELIDTPENVAAVDMALLLVKGTTPPPAVDEDVVLAFRKGQEYVDSLIGRQMLVRESTVSIDPDIQNEINDLFLRGVS
jgi:hypothetical protein